MSRTINLTVYKIEELSESAKKKALENHRYINVSDNYWHDFIYENYTELLEEEYGFQDVEIKHSGFSSQGDGASFTCRNIDLEKAFEGYIKDNWEKALTLKQKRVYRSHKYTIVELLTNYGWMKIRRNGYSRYVHANTCVVETYFDHDGYNFKGQAMEELQSFVEEDLTDYIADLRHKLCKDIYNDLEKEYEHQTSNEAVIETLNANNYEFYGDGQTYTGL